MSLPGRLSGFGEDRELIFFAVIGLFIGALIGAMAQIVPYALVILLGAGTSLLAWRLEGSIDAVVVMLGLLLGSAFGNLGNQMPYGVTVFFGVILAVMVWRTQGGSLPSGPTTTIAMILFIIVATGLLFNGTYLDFCNPTLTAGFNTCLNSTPSGYITAYQGCVNDCTISAFTFLGSSPFAYLITGNFVAFVNSFFNAGSQSPLNFGDIFSTLGAFISFGVGVVLLLLGLGIGINTSGEVLSTGVGGGVSTNMQGSRLFQSLGVGLILWSFFTGLVFASSNWFPYIGFGLGTATVGAYGAIYLLFVSVYTYECYEQARTWS